MARDLQVMFMKEGTLNVVQSWVGTNETSSGVPFANGNHEAGP